MGIVKVQLPGLRPLGVGFQNKLLLRLGGLDQFVSPLVGLDANENPNLLRLHKRRMKFVETADEKIAEEAIKEARVVTEQDTEAVAQAFAGLARDEGQVG